MSRFSGRFVAVVSGAVALGGSLFAPGCTHNDQSIFIQSVFAPPARAQGGVCEFTNDPGRPTISGGVLDAALLLSYRANLLVGNQLIARGDPANVRTESNRVVIKGAVVRVLDATGNEVSAFTRVATGFLDPSFAQTPSYGVVAVDVLDAQSVQDAAGSIANVTENRRRLVMIKVFGTTLGGQDVESNEFQFPIDICKGCLVSFPPESVDKAQAVAEGKTNCAASTGGSTGGGVLLPCITGQDQVVDCRLCQGAAVCDPSTR